MATGLVWPLIVEDRASSVLNGFAGTANRAADAGDRLGRSLADMSATEQRAVRTAVQHAEAVTTVNRAMAETADSSTAVQRATLGVVAAEDRLTRVMEAGRASAAQLADASSALIGARERLVAVEREAADAVARTGVAQRDAAVESSGFFASFSESGGGMLRMAGELGLIVGAVEGVKKVIDIGQEAAAYQRSMTQIRTLTGASAAEVRTMSSALLGLSGKVAQSPADLATSLYHVESVGLSGAKALDAVRVAAQGATIGGASLEDTTNALTSTIASGIIKTQSYRGAMSDLLTIVGSGDMTLQQFNESLSTGALTTLAGYGLSLRDVGAALALFGDNNMRGAQAATQLRMSVQALASPMKSGVATLDTLGLSSTSLAHDMQTGGLNKAIGDLKGRMQAAGITGKQTGEELVEAFGKRAGTGLSILVREYDSGVTNLQAKYGDLTHSAETFGQRWNDVTKTASFQFKSLSSEIQAGAIGFATAALPIAATITKQLGGALIDVLHVIGEVGSAFKPAFAVAGGVLTGAAYGLHGLAAALSAITPELKFVATAWAGMFIAQTGARAAVALVTMVGDTVGALQAKYVNAQIAVTSFWTSQTGAGDAAAGSAVANSATIGAAANSAATTVDSAGARAEIGWAGVAGPIGLAAGAVLAVVSMFHRSATASKEATDAAKAYSDALSSGGGRTTIVDTITKQLAKNNVPETLQQMNRALGQTSVTANQFVTAIESGGRPLDALRSKLDAVIKAGTLTSAASGGQGSAYVVTRLTPAAKAATKALADLNTQYDTLSKSTMRDLTNTKAFAGVSSSIDKTSQSTQVASKTAQQYAQMMGIVVDQNGVAAVSQARLTTAVDAVSHAYGSATQTGNDFLTALNQFAQSSGTAADRAAMIGATLKTNAGDSLNFAAQMNSAATAVSQLGADAASAAKGVGKSGESTSEWLSQIIDLKHGTIDYSKSAAAPLISDLQSVQSAAIAAAQATYQHNVRLEGGRQAAADAVAGYRGVESSLASQLHQMGLTSAQAQQLTQRYLGVPSRVRTLIEQEGADPVVAVLNKIGRLLANLTGQPWNPTIGVHDAATPILNSVINKMQQIAQGADGTVRIRTVGGGNTTTHGAQLGMGPTAKAAGGAVFGPGTTTSDSILARLSNNEHVWTAAEVAAAGGHAAVEQLRRAAMQRRLPTFAVGGPVYRVGHGWGYDGNYYAKQKDATSARREAIQNARAAALEPSTAPRHLASGVHHLRHGFSYGGQYYASYADATAARLQAQQSAAAGTPAAGAAYRAAIRTGDLTQTRAAYATLYMDARAAGASKKALEDLSRTEKKVVADLKARAVATARVAKAQTYLTNLQQKAADMRSSVAQAITGSFDITTAGTSTAMFNDRGAAGVTAGSMLSEITADANKAVAFRGLLEKLGREGLDPTLVAQLAQAGPSAYPQAQALAVATPKQIAAIDSQEGRLTAAAKAAGAYASNLVFGSQIAAAKALLHGYSPKSNPHMAKAVSDLATQLFGAGKMSGHGLAEGLLGQQKEAGDAAAKLGEQVRKSLKKSLGIASPSRVTRELGRHTGAGFALGLTDMVGAVGSAGVALGAAAVPSSAPTGGGDYHHHEGDTHNWTINEVDNGMETHHKVMRRMALAKP